RPDYYTNPIVIDWRTGTTNLAQEISNYFSSLKNNDKDPNNDVADLITVYILSQSHDHGLDTTVNDIIASISADNTLSDIKNNLIQRKLWNDTILIVTSDHGMTDVIKDNDNAIEKLEFSRELDADFDVTTNFTGEVYYDATLDYECTGTGETAEYNGEVEVSQCVTPPITIPTIKAAVISCNSSNDPTWEYINNNSLSLGGVNVDINYTALNKTNITLDDLYNTSAEVLILSSTDSSTAMCNFSASEISAISSYVTDGHGILGTGGTLNGSPGLSTLFGINVSLGVWPDSFIGDFSILQRSHPLFDRLSSYSSNSTETLSSWIIYPSAKLIAESTDLKAGIIVNETSNYSSAYLTHVPENSSSHQDIQLIYNAIAWLSNIVIIPPTGVCNNETKSLSKTDNLNDEFTGSGTIHKSGYANIDGNLHLEFEGMVCNRNEDVYLNGEVGYYYSDIANPNFQTDILPAAKDLYYAVNFNQNSSIYNKIARILIKKGSDYYEFLGGNNYVPIFDQSIKRLGSDKTGDFILLSNIDDKYYFQTPHKSIYGTKKDLIVPLLIGGPGFEYFDRGGNNKFTSLIDIVDIGPAIAYLIGGNKTVKLMSGVDGKNFLEPVFKVTVHSPVNLHLYDSLGRHTGPTETEIPTSAYRILEDTDSKEITLLQALDKYRIEIEAYNAGKFTLKLEKNTK
ncbi:MAG: alkaline phosphatase family protein, partial [Methanosarcinales archaeon]